MKGKQNKKILQVAGRFIRFAVTLFFLTALLAVDFENPKDILSLSTLHKIVRPLLLVSTIRGNLVRIWTLINNANWLFLALSLAAHLLCVGILAHRWKLLLKVLNIRIRLYRLYAYYLMGFFFNNFLPTNIGGDIARVYNTAKHENKMTESISVVFMERFIGFAAVFMLAFFTMFFHTEWMRNQYVLASMILFATGIGFTFWGLFDKNFRKIIKGLISRIGFLHLNEKLAGLYKTVYLFKENTGVLLKVFIISIIYQFALVFVNLFAACAIGSSPPFLPLFFVIQITTLVCVIPISLNGLGVREFLYVTILSMAGVAQDQIIAFQVILFLIFYAESLLGGIAFLLQKKLKRAPDMNLHEKNNEG